MKNKEIFLTKCSHCGKRIAVKVDSDKCIHNVYTCNECVPKTSCCRNGIEEAIETDLFDEIDFGDKSKEKLNVYILERQDNWKYDECIEQTIVAGKDKRAIELASKEPGIWAVAKTVDLTVEQVLTKDANDG